MKVKDLLIEQYLREGLLALVPVYEEDKATGVRTLSGEHSDRRTLFWLLKLIAAYYSLDLAALRKRCGAVLGLSHHISLAFTPDLVLLPVKVRQAAILKERSNAYINLLQVEQVGAAEKAPSDLPPAEGNNLHYRSFVQFKNGAVLYSLQNPAALQIRLEQGQLVRRDLLERRQTHLSYCSENLLHEGMSKDDLLKVLPPCDCLLKNIFIRLISG